jgi:hypothetical protein
MAWYLFKPTEKFVFIQYICVSLYNKALMVSEAAVVMIILKRYTLQD